MSLIYCSSYKCYRTAHGLVSAATGRPLCGKCHAREANTLAEAERAAFGGERPSERAMRLASSSFTRAPKPRHAHTYNDLLEFVRLVAAGNTEQERLEEIANTLLQKERTT